MFSNKRSLLKSLLTINAGCGCSRGPRIKDSLETRPREQPELIDYHSLCTSNENVESGAMKSDELLASASRSRCGSPLENSVAVEKHSDDPYADFKDSMLQMILDKEIYSIEDLQKLLGCFLKLNSPWHHEAIIRAFMDILSNINWTACPNN